MTDQEKAALIAEAMKASKAVFLATDESVADDLSRILKGLALALSESQPDLERVKREAGAAALREAAEAHSPGGMTIGYHGQFAHDLRERADHIERGE